MSKDLVAAFFLCQHVKSGQKIIKGSKDVLEIESENYTVKA